MKDTQQELDRTKKQLQAYLDEVTALLQDKKETERSIVTLQTDLEEVRDRYADLEGVVHKHVVEKLARAEDSIEYESCASIITSDTVTNPSLTGLWALSSRTRRTL